MAPRTSRHLDVLRTGWSKEVVDTRGAEMVAVEVAVIVISAVAAVIVDVAVSVSVVVATVVLDVEISVSVVNTTTVIIDVSVVIEVMFLFVSVGLEAMSVDVPVDVPVDTSVGVSAGVSAGVSLWHGAMSAGVSMEPEVMSVFVSMGSEATDSEYMVKSNGYVLTSGTHNPDHEYDEDTNQFIGRHVARQVNFDRSSRNAQAMAQRS